MVRRQDFGPKFGSCGRWFNPHAGKMRCNFFFLFPPEHISRPAKISDLGRRLPAFSLLYRLSHEKLRQSHKIDIEILFFVEYYITVQHKPCRAFILTNICETMKG